MPILRPKSSAPMPPRAPSSPVAPREGRTSSGTHRIPQPPQHAGAFGEEEAPTGRLSGTQLRKLVARSADPELTARKNAFGGPPTPFAMPIPAAAIPPKVEAPAIPPEPVLIVNGPGDAPEIEVLGEVDEIAAFPLVVPTPPARRSAPPAPAAMPTAPASTRRLRARRRAIALEPVDFARNILGHGYLARRFLGFVLLVALVATAAWTATGGH